MSMLNESQIRQYVEANHPAKLKDKDAQVRISKEFFQHLEGRLRLSINLAIELPCNRKTVRDLAAGNGR